MTTALRSLRVPASLHRRSGTRTDLKQILRPVDADLADANRRLLACLQNPVARKAAYLVTAGGKHLRPALVLLAGRSGRYDERRDALIALAVSAELIHTATLVHDDIIDQAALRRQQPTFHQRFGTERAVLMGDYLYSVAFSLLAGLEEPTVMQVMAEACQRLSLGEFLEVDCRFDVSLTAERYLEIIEHKTASLIAACCQLGAVVAGAPAETVTRLREFGLQFGMAFQIMDDCLDLTGDEQVVGKTLRSDLDKGSLSLPVIYLAAVMPKREREALFAPLRRRAPTPAFLTRIAKEARRSGAITRALRTAQGFLQQAMATVTVHDGVALADTYQQLARYALERVQ